MNKRTQYRRLLLAASALIFAFGGAMHSAAFLSKAQGSIDRSNLSPFLGAEMKVLWLSDSTTLIALAVITGFLAARPASTGRTATLLLALVPAGTAGLLYLFLGAFYAAHLLTAGAAMVFVAGLLTSAPERSSARPATFEHAKL